MKSHYGYLDLMVPELSKTLWPDPVGVIKLDESDIVAHGDKCYGMMMSLEDHNIHPYHTALLYLLTYTDKMDRPKHESEKWVLQNYSEYKDLILELERKLNIVL